MTSDEQFEKWFADLHAAGMTGTFVSDVSDYYNGAKAAWHIAYHARDDEIAALQKRVADITTWGSTHEKVTWKLQETIDALREQRRVLLENAQRLSRAFTVMSGCPDCGIVFADGKTVAICGKHAPMIGKINEERRAALEMCKEGKAE